MTTAQSDFTAALLSPQRDPPDGLRDGVDRAAGKRFDVYRNNVAVSLREALETGFPVITRLLGAENMKGIAGLFLRAHPPASPLMMHYGDAFPAFLEQMQQLSHLGYLGDVARLELALRRAYHAADAEPVAHEQLSAFPPETLMQARLGLAPALQIVRSDWPIHDIWRFNTQADAPKPRAVPQDVLITRAEYDPEPHLLPPGGAVWITALQQGKPIGLAHEQATTAEADFDPTACLALLLQGNAITSLTTEGSDP